MKFVIVSQYAGSKQHGMVIRNYNWATELVKQGHEVTLLSCAYSHYRQKPVVYSGRETQQTIDGVNYIWLWGPKYKGKNNIGRLLSMFIFVIQLYLSKKWFKGADVIVSSSPQPFTIFPSNYFAKKMNAKLIYDIRDLWPLSLQDLGGYSSKNLLIRLMKKTEDYSYKVSNLVTTAARSAYKYFEEQGYSADKVMHVANGIASSIKKDVLDDNLKKQISEIKSKCKSLVVYTGTIGKANAIGYLIDSFKNIDPSIHLILVGKGAEKNELKKYAKELLLDKQIHFIDPIQPTQIASLLENADIAFCGAYDRSFYNYGISLTKINDYMLASLPVVYAIGDKDNPVSVSGCGVCVTPEKSDLIKMAIEKISSLSDDERQAMGQKGLNWVVKNHSVKNQMLALVERLKKD